MNIVITYKAKWRLKKYPNYAWTECKKLVNMNNNREIKKTLNGLTPGYWISRKFIKLNELATMIELIPEIDYSLPPFMGQINESL